MSAGDPVLPETQSGLHVQDLVHVRGRRWRVAAREEFADCEAIALDGADTSNQAMRRTLIHPFDRPVRVRPTRDVRVVTRARWIGAFRELAASVAPADGLWTGATARIVLLPYQLEPALAVVRGLATRLLIADEVGLGKSIQAGLIIRELAKRRLAERVLILTPAGIRDQWAHELAARFALDAEVVDLAALDERARQWASGPNPWALAGVRIVSCDFIKRPEVLRALDDTLWDVLVIDEAHAMTSHSDRGRAARALACRARFVVLLTATPHSGDPEAFEALCELGAPEPPGQQPRWGGTSESASRGTAASGGSLEPLRGAVPPGPASTEKKSPANSKKSWLGAGDKGLPTSGSGDRGEDEVVLFRRRRADVGFLSRRKTRLLRIRPTAAERRMHELLGEYTRRVWREAPEDGRPSARLAVIVLRKRALSSAASLAASVARRLERLEKTGAEPTVQMSLPLEPDGAGGSDEAPEAILGAPGLSRRSHERAWLGAILNAALAAARRESKLVRLLRLLGRAREPAIVFTEYRDTLVRLARAVGSETSVAVLHGGLTRLERAHGERQFISGAARILLATDAAGEGLNLHVGGCRLVVNYELPWTPRRLEQRIGRVDRIGQTRTVHAVQLLGDATPESGLLERLIVRRQRIRTALDGADTAPPDLSERVVGEAVIDRESGIGGRGSGVGGAPAAAADSLEPMLSANARSISPWGPPPLVTPCLSYGEPSRSPKGEGWWDPTGAKKEKDARQRERDTARPIGRPPFRELDLRAEAEQECARLQQAKKLTAHFSTRRRTDRRSLLDQLDASAPWVGSLRISPRSGAAPAAAAEREGARQREWGPPPLVSSLASYGAQPAEACAASEGWWGPASPEEMSRVQGAAEPITPHLAPSTPSTPRARDVLQPGVLWIVRVSVIDGAGGLVETLVLPLLTPTLPQKRCTRRQVRALVRQMWSDVSAALDGTLAPHTAALLDRTSAARRAAFAALIRREQAEVEHLRHSLARGLVQLGLFDGRAAREAAAVNARTAALEARYRDRLDHLQRAAGGIQLLREPELVLVLLLTS